MPNKKRYDRVCFNCRKTRAIYSLCHNGTQPRTVPVLCYDCGQNVFGKLGNVIIAFDYDKCKALLEEFDELPRKDRPTVVLENWRAKQLFEQEKQNELTLDDS